MRRVLVTWDSQPIPYDYLERVVRRGRKAIVDHGGYIENDLQIVLGFVAIVPHPAIDALLLCSRKYRPVVELFPFNTSLPNYLVSPPGPPLILPTPFAVSAPLSPLSPHPTLAGAASGVPAVGMRVQRNATGMRQLPTRPAMVLLGEGAKETRKLMAMMPAIPTKAATLIWELGTWHDWK
ncbi:hypothetical protein MMC30_003125 [Trapelia coarctata]|nr:hypothetical protein [Trapelia coarctata]